MYTDAVLACRYLLPEDTLANEFAEVTVAERSLVGPLATPSRRYLELRTAADGGTRAPGVVGDDGELENGETLDLEPVSSGGGATAWPRLPGPPRIP